MGQEAKKYLEPLYEHDSLVDIVTYIEHLIQGDLFAEAPAETGDPELDRVVDALGRLGEALRRRSGVNTVEPAQMEHILELLVSAARSQVVPSADPLDQITTGIERLQKELADSSVSQRFSHSIIEGLSDGLLVVDLDERIIRANQAFRRLSGYNDDEILGRPANVFFHMRADEDLDIRDLSFSNRPHMPSHFFSRLARRGGRHELFLFTKDGGAKPASLAVAEHRSASRSATGYICLVQDISEQMRLERTLHRLALQDGLTGLPNRRAVDDVLSREWKACARAKLPLSVLMVDVDRFKPFNDHYGHMDGDDILRKIAKVVGASPRRPRDLAARYGGEEFIIVLPETDQHGATQVAENIRTSVLRLKTRAAPGGPPYVTVSVGVATAVPGGGLRAADLVEAADSCLYQAKEAGRNRVFSMTVVTAGS